MKKALVDEFKSNRSNFLLKSTNLRGHSCVLHGDGSASSFPLTSVSPVKTQSKPPWAAAGLLQ